MNAPALAEGEVVREARRMLRKLAHPGAELVPDESGAYALVVPGARGTKPSLKAPAAFVEAFRRRDWIEAAISDPARLILSDTGLGWLRRAMADDNPFAAQHQLRVKKEVSGPDGILLLDVNEGESPLGWLHRRRGPDGQKLITAIQFEAGERLRADFTMAQMTPRLAVDLAAPVVAGRRGAKQGTSVPEIVMAAKQRVRRALAAAGPVLADLLMDVCCHLTGLEAAERHNGWPRRSAKIVLQIALDRLAEHYGMAPRPNTRRALRSWHAPDPEAPENSGGNG